MRTSTNITLKLNYPCSFIYSTIIHLSGINKCYNVLQDSSYDCVHLNILTSKRKSAFSKESYGLYVFLENEENSKSVKMGIYIPKYEYKRDPSLYLEAYKIVHQFTSDLQKLLRASCN